MDRNISRIRWKCRRGMLELDLSLTQYLDHVYLQASPEEQMEFEVLLSEADADIWDWLMGIKKPKLPFEMIIRKIQERNKIPRIEA